MDLFLKGLEPNGVEKAGFYIFDLSLAPSSELAISSEENGASNCSNFMLDGSLCTFMLYGSTGLPFSIAAKSLETSSGEIFSGSTCSEC